jgi:hypothetical protein
MCTGRVLSKLGKFLALPSCTVLTCINCHIPTVSTYSHHLYVVCAAFACALNRAGNEEFFLPTKKLGRMPGLRSNIIRNQCTPCPLIRYLPPLLQVFVLCLHDNPCLRDCCFGLQSEPAVSDCTRVKKPRATTHASFAVSVRRSIWSQVIACCNYLKAESLGIN